jgi:hypothetical protein
MDVFDICIVHLRMHVGHYNLDAFDWDETHQSRVSAVTVSTKRARPPVTILALPYTQRRKVIQAQENMASPTSYLGGR